MILDKEFRDIIERELAERGWTRSEYARRVGVSPQTIGDYLHGRKLPGPGIIERFLKPFGLRPHLSVVPDVETVEA